jgi:hypothetical protein
MPDYSQAKIYKMEVDDIDGIYIGSTTLTLDLRLSNHKSHYKLYINGHANYLTAHEILKHPNVRITLIENYPCTNREELYKRECEHINNNPNCVNKNSDKTKDIKGYQKEYQKEYRLDNIEHYNQYQKAYYIENKEAYKARNYAKKCANI